MEGMQDWEYVFTWGTDLDVYAKGDLRRAVNRKTGEVELEYTKR